MKTRYDKKKFAKAKNPIEVLEDLYVFFNHDLYNKQFANQQHLTNYLDTHFSICKRNINRTRFKLRCNKCGCIIDTYPLCINNNEIICWDCNDKFLQKIDFDKLEEVEFTSPKHIKLRCANCNKVIKDNKICGCKK